MHLIDKIKEKIWPIRTIVRVLAFQFDAPDATEKMKMVILPKGAEIHFTPTQESTVFKFMSGADMRDAVIVMTRGTVRLFVMGVQQPNLNRREKLLLADAARRWLESDCVSSQVSVQR